MRAFTAEMATLILNKIKLVKSHKLAVGAIEAYRLGYNRKDIFKARKRYDRYIGRKGKVKYYLA